MSNRLAFDGPLHIGVVRRTKTRSAEGIPEFVKNVFDDEGDTLLSVSESELALRDDIDLAVLVDLCGSTPLGAVCAQRRVPCIGLSQYGAFHPYMAAFCRDLEKRGGIVLPNITSDDISNSVQAVRAAKGLKGSKLIVVHPGLGAYRTGEIDSFAEACQKKLGVTILSKPVSDLKQRAAFFSDAAADEELRRWYEEVLDGPGEMDNAHMRKVAKLYLAEKQMLVEYEAVGITVDDIGGFLTIAKPEVMPNVTYGPLTFDGYLACEEGDVEALVSELLLYAGLGEHPTMSNLYLAFRDQLSSCETHEDYTHEMERKDYEQCLADDTITASHFSTSGVLPPRMMEEDRYRVREALPNWSGQSMIASTPVFGLVVLARITQDCTGLHALPGEVTGRGFGDQYGWYRGRWFIRLPDVVEFIEKCQHHHYAVALENDSSDVFDILVQGVLGLDAV